MEESIEERERQFQQAYDRYYANPNQEDWDTMFMRVYDCCVNIAKKKSTGIRNPMVMERAMDAAIYAMRLIQRGKRPHKLRTYCYFPVVKYLYSNRAKIEDREISIDAIYEGAQEGSGEEAVESLLYI